MMMMTRATMMMMRRMSSMACWALMPMRWTAMINQRQRQQAPATPVMLKTWQVCHSM